MGNQGMEATRDDLSQASYQVIAYPAIHLPDQYRNMVLSKWLRSLRYGNEYFKLADSDQYYWAYEKYIKMLSNRPKSLIRLAVLADDHDIVLGWSMTEDDKLHYVWVGHEYRNKGIATLLVPCTINTITHLTKAGAGFWHRKLPSAKFNPF